MTSLLVRGMNEMPGFDQAWAAVAVLREGESVSADLRPLLKRVYVDILSSPTDLAALKKSLEELLEFLSGRGRTNANCWAVDLFFCHSNGWERDWTDQSLPEEFHDVLVKMGEALHDTVRSPVVAKNFDCLPEQLLEEVRNLRI
jgi:hypothetical protein